MDKLSQYFDISPHKKFYACTSAGRIEIYDSSSLAAQNLCVIVISAAHFTNFPVRVASNNLKAYVIYDGPR